MGVRKLIAVPAEVKFLSQIIFGSEATSEIS
jgi:hypothetical protein